MYGRVGGNCPDDVLDHEVCVLYCSSSPALCGSGYRGVDGWIRKSIGTNRRWSPAYVRLGGSSCLCSDLYVEIPASNIN